MRTLFVVSSAAVLLGLVAIAAEKPPAPYQKAMKDLGAFAADLDTAVMAQDYDAVFRLADNARNNFNVAEKFWAPRDPEAAKLAQTGAKAAADLVVMAGIKSQEGVAYAAMEAKAVCTTCHTAHRQELPDGTFEIK
jgi:hypothetical protein